MNQIKDSHKAVQHHKVEIIDHHKTVAAHKVVTTIIATADHRRTVATPAVVVEHHAAQLFAPKSVPKKTLHV
jgi:hypothetical protein